MKRYVPIFIPHSISSRSPKLASKLNCRAREIIQNSEAWTAYDRLFVQDAIEAPELQSGMTNKEFLDAISSASSMTTTTAADHITAKKSSASKSDKPTAPVVEASGEVKVDPPTKKKKKAAGRPA